MIASLLRWPMWAIGAPTKASATILRRYKIAPAPERSRTTTWKEFIRSHLDVLAGADFFTVEVLRWRGLITYYVLHDRDRKFCGEFRTTLAAGAVKCLALPARSPNLNSYAERWVRSLKQKCLSRLILFGENSLRLLISNYLDHFHQERNY